MLLLQQGVQSSQGFIARVPARLFRGTFSWCKLEARRRSNAECEEGTDASWRCSRLHPTTIRRSGRAKKPPGDCRILPEAPRGAT
eukprot:1567802-Pyramimonas_sp.AAC.1